MKCTNITDRNGDKIFGMDFLMRVTDNCVYRVFEKEGVGFVVVREHDNYAERLTEHNSKEFVNQKERK